VSRPSTRPWLVHVLRADGEAYCGAVPVTPRRCLHCEASPTASGPWLLCGVLLHRAHPAGSCNAPSLSVRAQCPRCSLLEQAYSAAVDQARAAAAREPRLPFPPLPGAGP